MKVSFSATVHVFEVKRIDGSLKTLLYYQPKEYRRFKKESMGFGGENHNNIAKLETEFRGDSTTQQPEKDKQTKLCHDRWASCESDEASTSLWLKTKDYRRFKKESIRFGGDNHNNIAKLETELRGDNTSQQPEKDKQTKLCHDRWASCENDEASTSRWLKTGEESELTRDDSAYCNDVRRRQNGPPIPPKRRNAVAA